MGSNYAGLEARVPHKEEAGVRIRVRVILGFTE
jgi:hypothetical protein